MNRRVVITGGSIITPLGEDWETVETALKNNATGIQYMPDWECYRNMNIKLAAPAVFNPPQYNRKMKRGMGRVAFLATVASHRAILAARLIPEELTDGSCGVSFGSSAGSPDAMMELHSLLLKKDATGISATTYIRGMPQTCAANISVFFGLQGRLFTTNTACTAGALSIGLGYEAIRYGSQDVMICGGADELNPTGSAVFDTLYATSNRNDEPEATPRPFDVHRDGLVVGEGAGALILEDYKRAKDRGVTIHAELVGFATNTDGKHITQPNRDTMRRVMEKALDSAGLQPKDIDYINAHGTATPHGDIAESHAVSDVFGPQVPISSIKGHIGHTLGACGAIEAWVAINMMNGGWFHGSRNLEKPDPKCAPLDYIMGDGRELDTEYIMTNNFAFGGINNSLIFKKMESE